MRPPKYTRESSSIGWAWLAVPLCTVLAVLAVFAIISWPPSGATVAKATSSAARAASLTAPTSTERTTGSLPVLREPSQLDLLRDISTLCDPMAGIALVSQLLDSFDRTGRGDDLYEAVQWMDRGWADGHYQSSNLPARVFERYCDYGALRWHWLCDQGE